MRMVRIKRDWKNRFTKSAVHSVTTFKSAVYMSKNCVGTKIDRNVFLKIICFSFGQWTLFDFLNKLYSTYTKTMKLHWNICSMATLYIHMCLYEAKICCFDIKTTTLNCTHLNHIHARIAWNRFQLESPIVTMCACVMASLCDGYYIHCTVVLYTCDSKFQYGVKCQMHIQHSMTGTLYSDQ